MQNYVFVSKHPVVILQNHVFNPKGTFATCETLFHFQNTLLRPRKTLFQFQNPFSQTATSVFKTVLGYCCIFLVALENAHHLAAEIKAAQIARVDEKAH